VSRPRRVGGVHLVDGPCAGHYSVRRAPHFLRAVRFESVQDVLDQLADSPRLGETVYVYELDTSEPWFDPESFERATHAIICPTPAAQGTYRHRADVDGNDVYTTADWRAWCTAQPGAGAYRDPLAIAFAEAGS